VSRSPLVREIYSLIFSRACALSRVLEAEIAQFVQGLGYGQVDVRIGVRFSTRARDLCLLSSVQNGCEANPVGGKAAGARS
jgi:hypothetical protein